MTQDHIVTLISEVYNKVEDRELKGYHLLSVAQNIDKNTLDMVKFFI